MRRPLSRVSCPRCAARTPFGWGAGDGLRRGTTHRRVVALSSGAILNRYWDDADTPRDESYREDIELARRSGRIPKQLYRDLRAAAERGWELRTRWFAA